MRVIGRLLVALAIALPISFVIAAGVATGQGGGPAVMKCMHWKDGMRIAPGVGNDPSNQTVTAHGKVYGCNKAGGGAVFNATLQMSQATCSNLAMSGSATFDWVNGTHSSAFLAFHPQDLEPRKAFVSGSITSGAFQGLIVRAWLRLTQVFSGSGLNCNPSNLLKEIEFTNSQSLQLLTPNVTPTTQPPGTTPHTGPPGTTPRTHPGTVPNTNQGGTTPRPGPPITVIIQGPPVQEVVIIHRRFPINGTLAFTGSSGAAAMFGLEALLIGGALACLDPEHRAGRFRFAKRRRGPKRSVGVTLPRR